MIAPFINIRIKQFVRTISGIGLFRILFLMFLVSFFLYGLYNQLALLPNAYYATLIYLFLIAVIQFKRKDKQFLKIHFSNHLHVLFSEYVLLAIPLIISLIIQEQWKILAAVPAIILLIVNLNYDYHQKSLNTVFQKLIPDDCYEWKSGLRMTLYYFIFLWLAGMAFSFFIGTVPVVLFILGILCGYYNERSEPLKMILSYEMSTKLFLRHKIICQLKLYLTAALPLVVAFLIFHSNYWYLPMIVIFIVATSHIYIILTKYSFYRLNGDSNVSQIFGAIGIAGLLIPFFMPVVWLLSVKFYFKSLKNLNQYLYDFN
jgi:hypothetical protein